MLSGLASLHFAWPALALLAPLPWLLRRLLPPQSTPYALPLPGVPLEAAQGRPSAGGRLPWPLVLVWLALLLAAMRPQLPGEAIALPAEGRDLLLAVDISGSMNEQDVLWQGQVRSRLQVVQAAAGAFLERRRGDRIALVLFGESAYLYTPLSLDTATAAEMLREVEVGLAGQKTAIGDALAIGLEHLLDNSAARERVIILLTDGENNAGAIAPLKAAELAADAQIRIHTIGLAGEARGRGLLGRLGGSGVDRELLDRLAQRSGGQSFVARGGDSLRRVYEELDRIEPEPVAEETRLPPRALYWLPLLCALLAALPLLRR